jgi:hypothetical protein
MHLSGRWPAGRILLQLSSWLLIAGLLLPIYGSWLDGHFLDLQPFHQHVFLGGEIKLNHHGKAAEEAGDVVSLPDQEAGGYSLSAVPLLLGGQPPSPPAAESGLSFSVISPFLAREHAYLPPPKKPPYAL